MMSKEAMKLALEALKQIDEAMPFPVAKFAQAALREALAEQPAKEKAPQSANCEAPGWISSDHARGDDCTTEQPYPDNFIEALMYDVAKRDSEAQQAYEDAFVNGTGVMLGDKRIDSASIYKEPVAWMHPDGRIWTFGRGFDKSTFTIPLYTSPPQRTWVGLTDEEIEKEWVKMCGPQSWARHKVYARTIEAKLKEKNT